MEATLHTFKKIAENVERLFRQTEAIELTLIALACGGHVLIEDVRGRKPVWFLQWQIHCMSFKDSIYSDILPSILQAFQRTPKQGISI